MAAPDRLGPIAALERWRTPVPGGLARGLRRPLPFAVATVLVYLALLFPLAAARGFDLSVFVHAGEVYVDRTTLAAPLVIFPGTVGYDGQFFYRFALHPLSVARSIDGITLDTPAKRMQRIGYPLLARLAALGRADRLPAALLGVNLAGLGLIAACAAWITRRRRLPAWLPIAIVAWPGFFIATANDTAEIASSALLLTALACYLSDRLLPYCLLGAGAALTRETTVPILAGVLVAETYAAVAPRAERRLGRVAGCGLALAPFGIWWVTVSLLWQQAPQPLTGNTDIGWPLHGAFAVLQRNLADRQAWAADPAIDAFVRFPEISIMCGLVAFGGVTARRVPQLLRRPDLRGPTIGWLLILALMSLLTANGPLIEPRSCFRAVTECWIVGCLLLAHDPPAAFGKASVGWLAAAMAVYATATVWVWTRILTS